MEKKKIKRKKFIRYLGLIILFVFTSITKLLVDKDKKLKSKKKVKVLAKSLNSRITFLDELVVIKNDNEIKFLSAKCSHLGCKINKSENNKLVCPCHGSQYDLNGNVIEGPAAKPLLSLKYKYNSKEETYLIEI